MKNSSVVFSSTGDIILKAGRHLILDYKLQFDKSDPAMIEEAIEAYDKGSEEFDIYYKRLLMEAEIQAGVLEMKEMMNKEGGSKCMV